MLTAMLAVENILGASHDVWKVNTDTDYCEEVSKQNAREKESRLLALTQPRIPERTLVHQKTK